MAYTRAKDRIELPSGRVLTLGEALDEGILYLKKNDEPGCYKYVAKHKDGDCFWPVGRTLYESRMKLPISARTT